MAKSMVFKMLLLTEPLQQNTRIAVHPSSKINNWLSIESPIVCNVVLAFSYREPRAPLDRGSLSTRTWYYRGKNCLNDRTREIQEMKILSAVYLTYGQRAFSRLGITNARSPSLLLVHDLFKKCSLCLFLKIMTSCYGYCNHFFLHVYSCLTALNN